MQDWHKMFIYKDGELFNKATGKPVKEIINGFHQAAAVISASFEKTNSSKVAITYRCDKIIFEMHHGIEVYAPNLKHLDGNNLNDRIENLSLPELDTHPLDVPELKKMVKRSDLMYVPRFGSTVSRISIGVLESRYLPLYTKYAMDRKCVIRGNPRVLLKNLNWLKAGNDIPRGFQVNNIDGDYRRCDLDNLELAPIGTPLKGMFGLHKHWFVKNGLLFNRNAFRSTRMPNGKIWVYYDTPDEALTTYSCIITNPVAPYDHSMRAIYPFMHNQVVIGSDSVTTKDDLIEHLTTGGSLKLSPLSSDIRKHISQIHESKFNTFLSEV